MNTRARWTLTLLVLATIALAVSALVIGWRDDIADSLQWHIVWQLQLPVVVTAIAVGAALSTSAGTLQVVLRNPLADPGIVGITSGASLVAAGLLLLVPADNLIAFQYVLPFGCFIGALISTLIIYRIARRFQGASVAVILAGIAISTVSGAIIGWMYLFSDAQSMRNLTFWLMGSVYQADWWVLLFALPVIVLSLLYQFTQAKRLNWLYLGDVQAAAAGVNPQQHTMGALIATALAVGAAVSVAGSIAFLGLLVPHFLRLVFGHDNRFILPASAACGAMVLLLVVCVTEAWQQTALPVSMITATLGGPLMLLALLKGRMQ